MFEYIDTSMSESYQIPTNYQITSLPSLLSFEGNFNNIITFLKAYADTTTPVI